MIEIDYDSDAVRALDDNARKFLGRIYGGDMNRYRDRLRAIEIENLEHVLDAGCGMGQWTYCLADLNKEVSAIELDKTRLDVARDVLENSGKRNVDFVGGSVDNLPFESESFNAVFSYSVVYYTDYTRTLAEFYRVLKPGGRLYFSTNGPGWYLYNIIMAPNPAENFNPRRYGIKAFKDTIRFAATGEYNSGDSLIMFPQQTSILLEKLGFEKIQTGPDGTLGNSFKNIQSFFRATYLGLTNVFEVLTHKPEGVC